MSHGDPVLAHPKPTKRPPKARKPIARYVRPKAKRATPRRAPYRTSDPAREKWCREQMWCINDYVWPAVITLCSGPLEASHMGPRATARVVPQCHKHHVAEWHGATAAFKGMNRDARREWAAKALAYTDARYAKETT